MNRLIFHRLAKKEFFESALWYDKQNPGLGARFILAVEKVIEKIQVSPEIYGYSQKPFREAAVPIFPYLIVFKFSRQKQTIYIVSVLHAHRNPKKKFRKIG